MGHKVAFIPAKQPQRPFSVFSQKINVWIFPLAIIADNVKVGKIFIWGQVFFCLLSEASAWGELSGQMDPEKRIRMERVDLLKIQVSVNFCDSLGTKLTAHLDPFSTK